MAIGGKRGNNQAGIRSRIAQIVDEKDSPMRAYIIMDQ